MAGRSGAVPQFLAALGERQHPAATHPLLGCESLGCHLFAEILPLRSRWPARQPVVPPARSVRMKPTQQVGSVGQDGGTENVIAARPGFFFRAADRLFPCPCTPRRIHRRLGTAESRAVVRKSLDASIGSRWLRNRSPIFSWQAVDKARHRWMRCPSTLENLGFSTGRFRGKSAWRTFSTAS